MKILILSLVVCCSMNAGAQMPDSVKQYIDTAITVMQTRSLFANQIDWKNTSATAFSLVPQARTYKDAFPAIAYAFKQLADYHGMFANEDTVYRYPVPFNLDSLISQGVKSEFLKGNRFVTQYFDKEEIAYLRIPSMNVFSQADIDKLANRLRDSLCFLLAKNPKGLVIDLRMNPGGNSAPMISGISPLFGDMLLGYGVDKDNQFATPSQIVNGVLVDENGNPMATVKNSCVPDPKMQTAILIGPSTTSSGEILAVYLKQLKNTRTFGEPSGHFCNATEGFLFANNQGYLLLSVQKIADASRKVYNEMFVSPDVLISSKNDNFAELKKDPTFLAAIDWLRGLN